MHEKRARTRSTEGRGARRRRETRQKLIRAAHAVMARKGIDATTLQEITEEADVAFGSFYNHFASKEAIVEAIMAEVVESFGESLDPLADAVSDPAEVLAASVRHTITRAADDQAWGWFLIRSGLSMEAFRIGLLRRMTRDIANVIAAGRGEADDLDYAVMAAAGAVIAIMSARLRDDVGDDAPERTAAIVLRLLGLPSEEAREIANRPLPDATAPEANEAVR